MSTNHSVPAHTIPQTNRNPLGRFLPGNYGGPGRPRGSRNRLSEQFIADLQADWERHGQKVIERVRRDDPAAYLRVVATLVRPVQPAEVEKDPFRAMTREELRAFILSEFPKVFPDLPIVPLPKLVNQPKLAAISPPRCTTS
jgi:hypothetical protein